MNDSIATPAPPGSAGIDETCASCVFFRKIHRNGNMHLKCGKQFYRWTAGPASDIKASLPACEVFLPHLRKKQFSLLINRTPETTPFLKNMINEYLSNAESTSRYDTAAALVFADWLEENGNSHLASVLRFLNKRKGGVFPDLFSVFASLRNSFDDPELNAHNFSDVNGVDFPRRAT